MAETEGYGFDGKMHIIRVQMGYPNRIAFSNEVLLIAKKWLKRRAFVTETPDKLEVFDDEHLWSHLRLFYVVHISYITGEPFEDPLE